MTGENMQIATIAVPLQEWQALTEMVKSLISKVEDLGRKDKKELLTTKEVCAMLNISRSTLQRYLNNGDLIPERIGNRLGSKLYLRRTDVEKLKDSSN